MSQNKVLVYWPAEKSWLVVNETAIKEGSNITPGEKVLTKFKGEFYLSIIIASKLKTTWRLQRWLTKYHLHVTCFKYVLSDRQKHVIDDNDKVNSIRDQYTQGLKRQRQDQQFPKYAVGYATHTHWLGIQCTFGKISIFLHTIIAYNQ